MKKSLKITLSLVGIILVAGLGSLFVNLGMEWFNALTKPSQWIPNIVIPIVWTIIYILASIVLVLRINREEDNRAINALFIINGILNVLWCLCFFTLKLTFIGNIVIILNLVLAYLLVIHLFKEQKLYGYLLSIYPLWVSIATTLNTALWILN
ncbi:MAG: tryptophan-rich sensory protein [Clostridia bacterium]|nr:tryptophan-rich sensory protein [Clostridia bacterium]